MVPFVIRITLAMSAALTLITSALHAWTPERRYWQIFFPANSAELTTHAVNGLTEFAYHVVGYPFGCRTAQIESHLDRAEASRADASVLGERRALATRNELRRLGVADSLISHSSKLIEELLVPQAPDDEPQNRRVVVYWSWGATVRGVRPANCVMRDPHDCQPVGFLPDGTECKYQAHR